MIPYRTRLFISMLLLIGLLCLPVKAAFPESASADPFADLAALEQDEKAWTDKIRDIDQVVMKLLKIEQRVPQPGESKAAEDNDKIITLNEQVKRLRAEYEKGLERWPTSPRLQNYYGELLYDVYGEVPSAIKHWQQAISLDYRYSNPHNNMALYYFKHGFYEEGLRELDEALKLEPKNSDYLYNMVQMYLIHYPQIELLRGWDREKIYKEAMKLSRKAVKSAPDDFELLQDYAVNFFAAGNFNVEGDWKKCAKAWEEAREKARTDIERFYTHLNEARAWIREGDAKLARQSLLAARKYQPESAVVKNLLAGVESGEIFEEDTGSAG